MSCSSSPMEPRATMARGSHSWMPLALAIRLFEKENVMKEETWEFHVLEEQFLVPIKLAVFSTYEDAKRYVSEHQAEYDGRLYVVQRLARFDYR